MTQSWNGKKLAEAIEEFAPGATVDSNDSDTWVEVDRIHEVCEGLLKGPEFKFDLLSGVTAVDYIDHFELVYHLTSLPKNARGVIKAKCGWGRAEATVPSVTPIWRGAELQEREIYDLMGIRFEGHPNLKRIALWEGFPGHPLRKDFATYQQSLVPVEEQS